MNNDPQTNPRESSDSIQELRDEMRRDVRGLTSAIERRPKEKPGVSPLAVVASVFGSLFVGAVGMSVYDTNYQAKADAETPPANIQAELQAAMSPYTQQLDSMKQALVAAQQTTTEESNARGLLLDRLAETVTSLQKSGEVQNAAFHERVDLLAEELAAKLAQREGANSEPTVAARQTIPGREDAAVQPANAEADVAPTLEETKRADEQPAEPAPAKPDRGELVVRNPSAYDLNLVINGEPVAIKSRGVTTIDVSIGTIKTQIANLPQTAQTWDKWETIDGAKRLTINVEASNDYYKLR